MEKNVSKKCIAQRYTSNDDVLAQSANVHGETPELGSASSQYSTGPPQTHGGSNPGPLLGRPLALRTRDPATDQLQQTGLADSFNYGIDVLEQLLKGNC